MAERQMILSRILLSAVAAATGVIGASESARSATNPASFDRGNPLWGITIESLPATRERPLFLPSRRPPVAAAIAAPEAPPPPPPPPVPDKPALDLLGTVAGNGVGYAVFLDGTTHDIVRLKTGEGQDGWILQTVKNREAVLVKNDHTAVMRLPSLLGEQR
jgi:general secretion pathway protein N